MFVLNSIAVLAGPRLLAKAINASSNIKIDQRPASLSPTGDVITGDAKNNPVKTDRKNLQHHGIAVISHDVTSHSEVITQYWRLVKGEPIAKAVRNWVRCLWSWQQFRCRKLLEGRGAGPIDRLKWLCLPLCKVSAYGTPWVCCLFPHFICILFSKLKPLSFSWFFMPWEKI